RHIITTTISYSPTRIGAATLSRPRLLSPFSFSTSPPSYTSTLSLHDALPISRPLLERAPRRQVLHDPARDGGSGQLRQRDREGRSEEHTSELQSRRDLVCRLLLEKKKKIAQLRINRPRQGQ